MRHLNFSGIRLAGLTLAGMSLLPAPVIAQDKDEFTIEEILVTAQKREQRLMDVPMSISAFTGNTLEDIGASQLADFLQIAPGVGIIDNESGTQNIQIRGISAVAGNATVGYYLDELPFSYIGLARVPDVRTYDIERVEILRGPQGTLYGDGSIGGTIRILTRDPDVNEFAASAQISASETTDGDGSSSIKGMLNVPLKEGVTGFRLVASVEDWGGWIDNTFSGVNNENNRDINDYRGKFRWLPNDNLDMVFSIWHSEEDTVGSTEALDNRTYDLPSPTIDTEYDVYSAIIRYSFASADLVSATSYMDFTEDRLTYIGTSEFFNPVDTETFSQEIRLTSTGTGLFSWTAGLIYRSMDQRSLTDIPDFLFTQDQTFTSDSFAVFGEGTWSMLDDKLDLTVGLRYFEDDVFNSEPVDQATLDLIQMLDPTFTGTNDNTFDSTNPRFNLSYSPNDDWIVYGNIAKGFRSGQSQPVITLLQAVLFGVEVPSAIEPETLWSYEIGTKGTFMDGRAQLEAAVFYNDWEDRQVLVVINPPVRGLVNGGTAESQGVELGLTIFPADQLQLKLSGGYTDAEFTENVPGANIVAGDQIPDVPELTLAASATYQWSFANNWQGFAYGGVQYASERTDVVNLATDGDATTTLAMRLGVEAEKWSAYLFAENLTDEDGAITPYLLGPAGPSVRFRPRTIGLQVGVSF